MGNVSSGASINKHYMLYVVLSYQPVLYSPQVSCRLPVASLVDALRRPSTCLCASRADEANHRVVNHTFADMHQEFKEDAVSLQPIVPCLRSLAAALPPSAHAVGRSGRDIRPTERRPGFMLVLSRILVDHS